MPWKSQWTNLGDGVAGCALVFIITVGVLFIRAPIYEYSPNKGAWHWEALQFACWAPVALTLLYLCRCILGAAQNVRRKNRVELINQFYAEVRDKLVTPCIYLDFADKCEEPMIKNAISTNRANLSTGDLEIIHNAIGIISKVMAGQGAVRKQKRGSFRQATTQNLLKQGDAKGTNRVYQVPLVDIAALVDDLCPGAVPRLEENVVCEGQKEEEFMVDFKEEDEQEEDNTVVEC